MIEFEYLSRDLLCEGEPCPHLALKIDFIARFFLEQKTDPAILEILSETLARTAEFLDADKTIAHDDLDIGLAWLALPDTVIQMVKAFADDTPRSRQELVVFALHLVDIAERLALFVFIPELSALSDKAERTGEAARAVGLARHLKG
ncbi:hypothetical protein KAI87_12200 [Myxococcota bacterium]|nr:hypothetical protein [Myxococcota bacterium]